mgnify:CR=1 FL=1
MPTRAEYEQVLREKLGAESPENQENRKEDHAGGNSNGSGVDDGISTKRKSEEYH